METMSDNDVAKLKNSIVQDLYAKAAAEKLLVTAAFLIEIGQPLPDALRQLLVDCLEHLADYDPLAAFGHLYSSDKQSLGRPRKGNESDREVLDILVDVCRVAIKTGQLNNTKDPTKSAFYCIALQRMPQASCDELKSEAKRIQSMWDKQFKTLSDKQRKSIKDEISAEKPKKK
jgi:hypothetical protein